MNHQYCWLASLPLRFMQQMKRKEPNQKAFVYFSLFFKKSLLLCWVFWKQRRYNFSAANLRKLKPGLQSTLSSSAVCICYRAIRCLPLKQWNTATNSVDFQKLKFGREVSYSGKIYILLQEKEQKPYLPHTDDDHQGSGRSSKQRNWKWEKRYTVCFRNPNLF